MRLMALAGAAILMAAAPVSIELPFSDVMFAELGPGLPDPEAINNNCLSCHSVEMVLNQPRLDKMQWTAEVVKMRNLYKAPIDPADDAAIIAWLTAFSDRLPKDAAKTTG